MHEKHVIVFEYGKAKITIPSTARTRLSIWLLTAILALGLSAYQLWKQRRLEQRIEAQAEVQDLLVKQLRECLGQSPIPQKPAWVNSSPAGMIAPKQCPPRLESPLRQLIEAEASRK